MKRLSSGFLILLVNSAYLAARADASLFYFANVGLHMTLGVALAVAAFPRLNTSPSRLGGSIDNNERQAIHEHESAPAAMGTAASYGAAAKREAQGMAAVSSGSAP